MKFEVDLGKKYLFGLIVVMIIFLGVLGVYAYDNAIPNPGHGGDQVWVTTPDGNEMTLQDAIDMGAFTPITPSVGGDGLPAGSTIDLGVMGAGGGSVCALVKLNTTGTGIKCSGANTYGQLGVGDVSRRLNFKALNLNVSNAVQISTYGDFNFALLSDGAALGWGYNGYGQLGTGGTANALIPHPVLGSTGQPLTGIIKFAEGRPSSGYQFVCLILNNGHVKCSGYNGYGQLGNGKTTSSKNFSDDVVGIANARDVKIGGHASGGFACALLPDSVKCWGYNGYGQLGNGKTVSNSTTVSVLNLPGNWNTNLQIWNTSVTDVELANDDYGSAYAITAQGDLYAWGYNGYGQLGTGNTTSTSTPNKPLILGSANGRPVKALRTIGAGATDTVCAITGVGTNSADGDVYCWGYNGGGSAGQGTTASPIKTPTKVATLSSVADIEGFGWGNYNTFCALTTNGKVWCWGYNGYGQTGIGSTTTPQTTPVNIQFGNVVTNITMSGYGNIGFGCATLADNNVKCWGYNANGGLGTGDTLNVLYPTQPQAP